VLCVVAGQPLNAKEEGEKQPQQRPLEPQRQHQQPEPLAKSIPPASKVDPAPLPIPPPPASISSPPFIPAASTPKPATQPPPTKPPAAAASASAAPASNSDTTSSTSAEDAKTFNTKKAEATMLLEWFAAFLLFLFFFPLSPSSVADLFLLLCFLSLSGCSKHCVVPQRSRHRCTESWLHMTLSSMVVATSTLA
jgi:hypothetical protein